MKRTLGRIAGITVVLFVVATYLFPDTFRYLVDAVSFPWAYSFRGEPTLTGRWQGAVNFEGRASREMTMEIERATIENIHKPAGDSYVLYGTFAGKAEMPDEFGNPIHYALWGRANRSGSDVSIKLSATNSPRLPALQPVLQELNGSWKGNSLELSGKYSLILYDGIGPSINIGETTPPVSTIMTRQ